MENSNASLTIKDIVARLDAREAFLMTPQGKQWKKIMDQTVDYLDIIPTAPLNFQSDAIVNMLKGGFKRGEFPVIAALPCRYDEPRTNFALTMALERLRAEDQVIILNLERSTEDVERSIQTFYRGKARVDSVGAFKVAQEARDFRFDDPL